MDAPLLSLSVPVYNGAKYLPDCLDSLRAALLALPDADRGRVEIVLCDNHSTDGSRALLDAHGLPGECRVVEPPAHFENRTKNWDYGLRAGRGEWIVMLHADDRMAPDGFGAMLRAIGQSATARASLIGGRHRIYVDGGEPGPLLPKWPLPALVAGGPMRQKILPLLCVFLPFMIMRRAVYEEIGGLDERYELVQDWDLWNRILARGDYYYHPEAFCHWLSHPYNERLTYLFARDHLTFVARLEAAGEGRPGLSGAFQLAKVRTWLPDADPASLIAGTPEEAIIRALPPVSAAEAPGVLKTMGRRVGLELQALRLAGFFRR